MSNLFGLTDQQIARFQPYFPNSHGKLRVDDRRVLRENGPSKTLYNRWKRWSNMGVVARIMNGLAAEGTGKVRQASLQTAHRIEIMFGRLKDWRRVATRYDRCPKVFLSAIALAALVIYWL